MPAAQYAFQLLMQEAADNFEKAIAGVTFNNPNKTLFSNVTGKEAVNGEEIKKNAVLHLTNPVRWTDEEKVLNDLIKSSGDEWVLIEPGVGTVLTGLWAKSGYAETAGCTAVNSAESIKEI